MESRKKCVWLIGEPCKNDLRVDPHFFAKLRGIQFAIQRHKLRYLKVKVKVMHVSTVNILEMATDRKNSIIAISTFKQVVVVVVD